MMYGCKYSHHYEEYLGEKWMGSCQMFECTYDGDKKVLDTCEEDNKCPAFEPVEEYKTERI